MNGQRFSRGLKRRCKFRRFWSKYIKERRWKGWSRKRRDMSTCEETFHETTSRRISRISQRTKRTADGIWAFVLGVLFGSIVDLTRVGHQDVAVSILVRRPCTQLSLLITSEYATPIHARENALLRTRFKMDTSIISSRWRRLKVRLPACPKQTVKIVPQNSPKYFMCARTVVCGRSKRVKRAWTK